MFIMPDGSKIANDGKALFIEFKLVQMQVIDIPLQDLSGKGV